MKRDNDKILKEAALIAASELIQDEELEDVEFSKKHIRKMEKLFSSQSRKQSFKLSKASRIAACIIGAFCLFGAVWGGVTAWKRTSMEYNFKPQNPGTHIVFSDGEASHYASEKFSFKYLPGGFAFKESSFENGVERISFEKSGLYFELLVYLEDDINSDDISGEDKKKIKINENEGIAVEDSEVNIIFWQEENLSFLIKGNLVSDELIKIAENMKYYG